MSFRLFLAIGLFSFNLSFAADLTELSASLLFHVNEQIDEWNGLSPASISFSTEEEAELWGKLREASHSDAKVERAYTLFIEAKNKREGEGIDLLRESAEELTHFWKGSEPDHYNLIEHHAYCPLAKSHHYPITSEAREEMAPYVLPKKHKLAKALNDIFTKTRATKNMKTFEAAGFHVLHIQPRSFILVASHKKLPKHLLKVYLDDEERLKQKRPGWKWFVFRCQGAKKIAKIIKKKNIKFFTVPKKYIYILPEEPAAPSGQGYKPKIAVLVVEDMDILSHDDNEWHWRNAVTEEILVELYTIISRANGSSYRAGNIPFTNSGKIAFIDTEYPYQSPDYRSIRHYLSNEMRDKWDNIVKHHGK